MDYIPGVDGEGIPRVLACFMEALMRGKPLSLVNGGTARRTLTYIEDGVNAVMAALARPERATSRIFNVGNPANEVTIVELAKLMIQLYEELRPETAGTHRTVHVSGTDFYGEGYEDSDRRVPDIRNAQTLLGWAPRVGLEEALRTTMAAYVDAYSARIAARAAC
jgi:UDP-apiose/xylose synthase